MALALRDTGIESGVFEPLAALDGESLTAGRAALAGLAGDGEFVGEGADEELDRLRDQLGQIEDLAAASMEVVEAVQEGARRPDEFQDALVRHVTSETGIDAARVRDAVPREATDARDFVDVALRTSGTRYEATYRSERKPLPTGWKTTSRTPVKTSTPQSSGGRHRLVCLARRLLPSRLGVERLRLRRRGY